MRNVHRELARVIHFQGTYCHPVRKFRSEGQFSVKLGMLLSAILFAFFATVSGVSIDLTTGEPVSQDWLEVGYIELGSAEWLKVATSIPFNEPVILGGLPDIGGPTHTQGVPLALRLRNINHLESGLLTFEMKVSSFCLSCACTI